MGLSIEQLRAQFKQNDKGGSRPNNYYPFWNMKEGETAVVRFLPDSDGDNPMGFMVEKLMHTLPINGERKKVPCMKMYGEDCPACKVSKAYYDDGDKTNGKQYWRQKQHVVQALIMEDPLPPGDDGEKHTGKVRFMTLSFQLFNIIKDAFESGELDEIPYAYDGGYNFAIKKTKQGEYASYALGSNFVRKATDLTEDEVATAQDGMVELSSLLPANPGAEKVEAMVEAALTGSSYNEDDDSGSSTDFKSVGTKKPSGEKAKVDSSKPEAVVAEKDVVSSDDSDAVSSDTSDAAEDILTQIRNRKQG